VKTIGLILYGLVLILICTVFYIPHKIFKFFFQQLEDVILKLKTIQQINTQTEWIYENCCTRCDHVLDGVEIYSSTRCPYCQHKEQGNQHHMSYKIKKYRYVWKGLKKVKEYHPTITVIK